MRSLRLRKQESVLRSHSETDTGVVTLFTALIGQLVTNEVWSWSTTGSYFLERRARALSLAPVSLVSSIGGWSGNSS